MYNSCKTPSPILIPGYKFMKTLQMVSLDDVTTTFVPSSHKCSGNETESTSLQTAEERGFFFFNYYNFFAQVLRDFVYDEHFWRLVTL